MRPGRVEPDLWRPIGVSIEEEPSLAGPARPAMTVFLAGAECPFSCVFCDLWKYTSSFPTPLGALPAQLELALGELEARAIPLHETQVKLYNASNFFEDRAVPAEDRQRLLHRLREARQVTVECHPRLIRDSVLTESRAWLGSARLEVALGLETANPEVLHAIGKEATVDDFRQASSRLEAAGVGLRVFLLLGVPFLSPGKQEPWLRRSIRLAVELGASVVTLIPVRGGNGSLEKLERDGLFQVPTLSLVEELCEAAAQELGQVRAEGTRGPLLLLDPWDLERLAGPEQYRSVEDQDRLARLCELGDRGLEPGGRP